jgi:hypothetical protein
MRRTRYGGTLKRCSASIIPSQGMVLKAFVMSRETTSATPLLSPASPRPPSIDLAEIQIGCRANQVRVPSYGPLDGRQLFFRIVCPPRPEGILAYTRTVSPKGVLPCSAGSTSPFSTSRGILPSLRYLVNRLCRWGARVFINSAQTRPGIPSGPGVTSPRDAILFIAAKSSSWVTRSSSLHFMVSLRWKDGVRLAMPPSYVAHASQLHVNTVTAAEASLCLFPSVAILV